MADLPLIPFSEPIIENYSGSSGGDDRLIRPSRESQSGRLDQRFSKLDRLSTPEGLAELRGDPGSIAPERAIVFELADASKAAEMYRALRNIPDFEVLGDDEDEVAPAHGFAKGDKKGAPTTKLVRHRLYFAMPSVEALKTLHALWRRYKSNQPFDRKATPKLTAWRDVFDNLHDVRPWGPADRLPQEIVDAWLEDLEQAPDELHRIEIELWYRDNPKRQDAASKCVREQVKALGGTAKDEQVIGDIHYHAILADLPAASLRRIMAEPVDGLSAVDEVMFLRTQTLVRIKIGLDDQDLLAASSIEAPLVEAEPIVAMFDGVPLAAHDYLRDRMRLDDPHNLAGRYGSVAEQQHGTAMASIILNGDGHAPTPVPHRLYVQPVTIPLGGYERFPPERLTVHDARGDRAYAGGLVRPRRHADRAGLGATRTHREPVAWGREATVRRHRQPLGPAARPFGL